MRAYVKKLPLTDDSVCRLLRLVAGILRLLSDELEAGRKTPGTG